MSKQMPFYQVIMLGQPMLNIKSCFQFQFGNDTRRRVYRTYSHSTGTVQSCCMLRSWSRKAGFRDQWHCLSHQFPCLYLSSTLKVSLTKLNQYLLYTRHHSHQFTSTNSFHLHGNWKQQEYGQHLHFIQREAQTERCRTHSG